MASEHNLALEMKKTSYIKLLKEEEEEEEEEEEALSLCDLPTIDDNLHNPPRKESPKSIESFEEFNFCSNDSELCAADDIFFQGQILPMRHSVSSSDRNKLSNQIKSNSSVESIDHCSSGGFTSGSSRSSSISSRYSSSSVNSVRVINQFQFSHPSPKPQIKPTSNTKNGSFSNNNSNSKSQLWSLFRVGLVTTPEIGIQDLKFRTNSSNNRSRRNSNNGEEKKKKQKMFFNKNVVLFGGCKCSASTIGTVDSRIAVMKRNQSAKEEHRHEKQTGKQALSRHRTFEWLKQLSLETVTHEL